MHFLFYLLTVCLAVPIEKVNQVLDTKDAPPFGNDLLKKLKSSKDDKLSKLLITSLADADPDAVRHVKSLVEALIAAGEGERDTYTQDRDAKQTAFDTASGQLDADTTAHTTVAGQLSDARDEVTRLERLKADGQTAKDDAQEAYDHAVTSLGEAQGWLDDETTRVDSEKETLEEIRRLLTTLLPAETDHATTDGYGQRCESESMTDVPNEVECLATCNAWLADQDDTDLFVKHASGGQWGHAMPGCFLVTKPSDSAYGNCHWNRGTVEDGTATWTSRQVQQAYSSVCRTRTTQSPTQGETHFKWVEHPARTLIEEDGHLWRQNGGCDWCGVRAGTAFGPGITVWKLEIEGGEFHQIGVASGDWDLHNTETSTSQPTDKYAFLYSFTTGWDRFRGAAVPVGKPWENYWWDGNWNQMRKGREFTITVDMDEHTFEVETEVQWLGKMKFPDSWTEVYPAAGGQSNDNIYRIL